MKRFFAQHAKSSALVMTLTLHGALLVLAMVFVAFKVLVPSETRFRDLQLARARPRIPLNPKPFQTANNRTPKPATQPPRIRITSIRPTAVSIPPVAMIGVPMLGSPDSTGTGIPIEFDADIDFFDAKAKGEKICFVVHFGPATIGKTPYSRMTGYTIRKRLEDIVFGLPDYALFNVACFWAGDTCAMAPKMMNASAANKQKVLDWMQPVNPLEGDYDHCFVWQGAGNRVKAARGQWPMRVEGLPRYSPKWTYPYRVPKELEQKYLGEGIEFMHWGRGVAWAILTQKPDTIFVLTTNYIDGWGSGGKGEPAKMANSFKKMLIDVYGPDKNTWPTLNVVVLSHAGRDSAKAYQVLNGQFGPLVSVFRGSGSVIEDISKFMNAAEKKLLRQYASEADRQ